MEGWQKGAEAVLKMSGAGKERYFQNFPDRKEWFQANYPEHFGRSAAAATSSLKKVTKAKQQKQRLAAIRQAAEKRDQSTVLTPERRLMAQRRREGGEGLAGGMDTVADIRKTIAAGMPVRSGGIGSLFEADKSANTEPDTATTQNEPPKNGYDAETGMYYYNGVPYNTQKEADEAEKNAEESKLSAARLRDELLGNARIIMGLGDAKDKRYGKKKDPNQPNPQKSETPPPPCSSGLPPDRSTNFRCRDGTSVDGVTPPPSDEPIIPTGRDWAETNPDWGANLGMQYPTNRMDTETERALLMKPQTSAGRRSDRRARKSLTKEISIRANEEYAKELAKKTIQECMPMPMNDDDKNWDDMKTWQDNPIPRMSKKSEADEEPGEYDYEGDMAKSQLRSIMHNSKMLHDMLEDKTNLPEWVQSKITLAEDYILTAANYMRGELMSEEVEQIDEAFDKSSPAHAKAKELVSNYGNRSAVRAVYHGDGTATIHTTGNKKVSSATRVDHIHDQAGLGYNRSAEAYRNLSKSKGGLKFKTIETEGKSIYGSHKIRISNKGMKEEVEQIGEGADRWEYSGTVNGKKYTVTIPRGADLSDHLDLGEIQSENPHLEPHEVKAVADTSGEYEDHVEVEHEGEKYTHYVTNNEEPRMIYMDEEVEQIEEGKGYAPGWMLKKDKDLGAKVKEKIDLAKKRQASYGKPKAGISVMPPTDYGLEDPVAGGKFNAYMQNKKDELAAQAPTTDYSKDKIEPDPELIANKGAAFITPKPNQQLKNYHTLNLPFDPNAERPEMSAGKHPEQYRYVRNLARKAMKAGIAAAEQPVTHNDLVAQHMNLHNPQDGEVMEEGAGAARRAKSNDLVKRSMLPDKSVIPPGKGFGDDIKKQKIIKKVSKAIQKKRMALPTDNPSANELVPKSMLPDVPGYPEGYLMEEQVVEQPVEQHVEVPVVEENASPFVSAGSKFLTRTSTRLVYGDKND